MKHKLFDLATAAVCIAACLSAIAAPVAYEIDPSHTFPSFEADHMGMSMWRGKFNRSRGKVVLDKAAGQGTVDITIDTASIDFGLTAMNNVARGPELMDVDNHGQATYRGRLEGFEGAAPTRVAGELTLRGVTRPVELKILSFKCMAHPLNKRDWCGADAVAVIDRAAFGIDTGKQWGFKMQVNLRIQVEAVALP